MLQMPVEIPTLYDYCMVIPGANGTVDFPMLDQDQGNFGGVAFTWKASEGLDKGETEPVFKAFQFTTHELSGWTEMSLTLLRRSAISLESYLTTLFRNACRYEWSKKVWAGTGTNQPEGITVNASVGSSARNAAGAVGWLDIRNLIYGVTRGNRLNSMLIMDDSVEKSLVGVQDGDDRPLFAKDPSSGLVDRLAGFKYVTHEFGPLLGVKGDIGFGNLNNYAFGIEEDISIARSEHAEFKAGKVVFRLICFVGGKTIHPSAFELLDA